MGSNNATGLGGGVLAAIIVMTTLFFAANQSRAAGNGTNITDFHVDPDVLFSYGHPDLELATTNVLNVKFLIPPPPFYCGRVVSYRPCTPDPQNSKKGEHCKPAPGSTYPPPNRAC